MQQVPIKESGLEVSPRSIVNHVEGVAELLTQLRDVSIDGLTRQNIASPTSGFLGQLFSQEVHLITHYVH